MTNFNTDVAYTITSNKAATTANDVATQMLELLTCKVTNQIKSSLVKQDLWAIADLAKRQGCYQLFAVPFGVRLYINGYKVVITKCLGQVCIIIENKAGFVKYQPTLSQLKEFLKEIVGNSANDQ